MALNFSYTNAFSQKPTGTLASEDLFYKPPIPTNSQAAGLKGTDGRGYTRQVGTNEIASTHLNQMLDSNDPYMQNARKRGLETAARRGMLNSSIAAGNSQRAAIEAASPFAMQAADTYGRAQTENLGYMNQNLINEREIGNKVLAERLMAEAAAGSGRDAVAAAEAAAQNQYRMFQEGLAFDGEQRGLDRAHDFGISDMGYRQQRGLNEQGYGFDLGRQNNQNSFTSREADRDVYRDNARTDNLYSNQRNNTTYQTLLDSEINRGDQALNFMLTRLAETPDASPQDLDGLFQWINRLSGQQLDDTISMYLPQGGF